MPAAPSRPAPGRQTAVDKALFLLTSLAEQDGDVGVSELARHARLTKSTAFRRLGTRLHDMGNRVYGPTPQLLQEQLLPHLADLSTSTRSTATARPARPPGSAPACPPTAPASAASAARASPTTARRAPSASPASPSPSWAPPDGRSPPSPSPSPATASTPPATPPPCAASPTPPPAPSPPDDAPLGQPRVHRATLWHSGVTHEGAPSLLVAPRRGVPRLRPHPHAPSRSHPRTDPGLQPHPPRTLRPPVPDH